MYSTPAVERVLFPTKVSSEMSLSRLATPATTSGLKEVGWDLNPHDLRLKTRVDVLQQAVGMLFQMTDEVVEPETFTVLCQLNYGATCIAPVGLEPTTPGVTEACTPIRQSVMFWWRRRYWPECSPKGINEEVFERANPLDGSMYSKPAVADVVLPNEGLPRAAFQRYGRSVPAAFPSLTDC